MIKIIDQKNSVQSYFAYNLKKFALQILVISKIIPKGYNVYGKWFIHPEYDPIRGRTIFQIIIFYKYVTS